MTPAQRAAVERAVAGTVARTRTLAGGHDSDLLRVDLADGRRLVAKIGRPEARLATEGFMLRHLAERTALPVPRVHLAEDRLLVMDWVESDGRLDAGAQEHAADLIAALHAVEAPRYGFPRDTRIGPLDQPNGESADWIAFFRDRRLLHMARAALDERAIDPGLMRRIERLAGRLGELIGAPAAPSLVHGDLWSGNVLAHGGRIAAFIDPAIYHADPEVDLAFATLFSTFGEPFFRRYADRRPIRAGFFELRRDLYNLYPLLVHARLFGGSYVGAVDRIVSRLSG